MDEINVKNKIDIFKQSREYAQENVIQETYSMTKDENNIVAYITREFEFAESSKSDVERRWEDEYKIYKGGGLQWQTSFSYKKQGNRPPSEINVVFPAIENIVSNLTQNIPECTVEAQAQNREQQQPIQQVEGMPPQQQEPTLSKKISDMLKFNDERNKFRAMWKNCVRNFVAYGPLILSILWDEDWIGGTGPNRWVGDIRINNVKKEEFFPDPSITDLEMRLQECRFIIRRIKKQTEFIRLKYKKGISVSNDTQIDGSEAIGSKLTNLIEFWHKGFPFFVPDERKKELRAEIEELKNEEGTEWKIKEYESMIKGEFEGIHLCYIADNQFLEYIPYAYDHGQYPFVFKSRYIDEGCQWPWGEIRNIKIPQVLMNKADEIEIDSMCRQGLGGEYIRKGAATRAQLENMKDMSSMNGAIFEIDQPEGIVPRQPVVVPGNITNYMERKRDHISGISVSQIQMGNQPKSGMAYRTIQELGNRADAKTAAVAEILEDALIDMNKLRIALMEQFYTEDRYYRVKGRDGNISEGILNKNEMFLRWDRITVDQETGMQVSKPERFEIEFDVNVKIIDEKPTDRGYYTTTALQLYPQGLISIEDVWYTLEEGKFPPKETILDNINKMRQQQAQAAQAQAQGQNEIRQQEAAMRQQEMEMKQIDMMLKHKESASKQQEQQQQQQNKKMSVEQLEQEIEQNYPEIYSYILNLPDKKQREILTMLANLTPENLQQALNKLQETIPLMNGGEEIDRRANDENRANE